MISEPNFPVDEWSIREDGCDIERLAQSESVFALGNGHIGVRGNLDEGEPFGLPGTYLNGFYESRPLPYAEAGYGYPEAGQTVVNVTNGKLIRLLVDDEPFDVRYGHLVYHQRQLDMRAGVLRREVEWRSPGGRNVRVRSTRMVSLVQRAIMGIEYEVEAVGQPARVVVQSELVANEQMPVRTGDPRVAAMLESPLVSTEHLSRSIGGYLGHRTRVSCLQLAARMEHLCDAPEGWEVESEDFEDSARTTFIANLAPAEKLRIVKLVAYGWSATRSIPALRDQVAAAAAAARHTGWEGMLDEQRAYLDDFWERSDVEIEGDPEIQQAVRFSLFQVLQAGARAEGRAIPAKGLTGPGYDGHAFWDTDGYVLPVLTYSVPSAAADALRWRHEILPQAKERARQLGLKGAAFPWRTIAGEECSAYWPAGTAAFHIAADVADAVIRFWNVAGNSGFGARYGTDLLVETARLWASLGYFDDQGEFRIDGVTGPDEYSAIADNNVYTNVMARRNLEAAVRAVRDARALADQDTGNEYEHWDNDDVTDEELKTWARAAARMRIPYDERLGVHPQADGFTDHERWSFDTTPPQQYPLLLHYPYFDLYRKQVVKQADLVMALFRASGSFTHEEKVRDFEYYEELTVRDSSLSACVQAILAAETGHLELAYDYWGEAALMDLDDLEHNTKDGLHIASLAGSWMVAVCGFGGMRDDEGQLRFRPRLPSALSRLAFRFTYQGNPVRVDIRHDKAVFTNAGADGLDILFYDEEITLKPGASEERPILAAAERRRPDQPLGRAPARRGKPVG